MIPLTKPYYDSREEDAVKEVLHSGWITQGPVGEKFEKELAEYLQVKHVITLSSCTAGLYLSLLACDIGAGDEVIVPSFTFPATGLSVLWAGATPVFVDVGYDYNILPHQIEGAITHRTKAIMMVHQFGMPCDITFIHYIAEKHKLILIEDAACAFGASYLNKKVGTFGDVGCFSLHARKGMTTGEGGIVVTDNADIAREIRKRVSFGVDRAYKRENPPMFQEMGYNFKYTDIQAAIGLVQLSKIGDIISLRAEEKRRWDLIIKQDEFLSLAFRRVLPHPAHVKPVYQSYVRSIYSSIPRQKVKKYFEHKGFETGVGTFACHLQPVFCNHSRVIGDCILSAAWAEETISLPIFPGLNLLQKWEK